jgi:hypothetical protein
MVTVLVEDRAAYPLPPASVWVIVQICFFFFICTDQPVCCLTLFVFLPTLTLTFLKTGEREQDPLTFTIKGFPAALLSGKEIFFFALTTVATATGAD